MMIYCAYTVAFCVWHFVCACWHGVSNVCYRHVRNVCMLDLTQTAPHKSCAHGLGMRLASACISVLYQLAAGWALIRVNYNTLQKIRSYVSRG